METEFSIGSIYGNKKLTVDFFKPQSRLTIVDGVSFELASKIPNAFWRFWQRVLLGWRWERIK